MILGLAPHVRQLMKQNWRHGVAGIQVETPFRIAQTVQPPGIEDDYRHPVGSGLVCHAGTQSRCSDPAACCFSCRGQHVICHVEGCPVFVRNFSLGNHLNRHHETAHTRPPFSVSVFILWNKKANRRHTCWLSQRTRRRCYQPALATWSGGTIRPGSRPDGPRSHEQQDISSALTIRSEAGIRPMSDSRPFSLTNWASWMVTL